MSKCITEIQSKFSDLVGKKSGNGEIFNDYRNNVVNGDYSHASGTNTIANNLQFVTGRFNTDTTAPTSETDTTGSIFVVGNGTATGSRANALRISADGQCMGVKAFLSSGADYAEMFEWLDGNPDNEDRRGRFVTLDGEKIRLATSDDDYILGVISATPTIIGDAATDEWHDRFKTDVFGERLTETVTVDGKTETHFIVNPDYNSEQEYKGRNERKEWAAVGFMGKLIVVDDGSCEINSYCKVAVNGTATKSTEKTAYRVLSRIDKNHIKILVK